jgi:hypothetical protein
MDGGPASAVTSNQCSMSLRLFDSTTVQSNHTPALCSY